MIDPERFCVELERRDCAFFSGVPCSYLQGPFARLEERERYVAAPNEGVAVSMAAGAELAGRRAVVLLQNSGLGNLLDPLTSLLMAYEIPLLLFVSLRGWADPSADEPHHAPMGRSTIPVLDAVGIAHGILQPHHADLIRLLDRADEARRAGRSFAVLVPSGTIGTCRTSPKPTEEALARKDAVAVLARHLVGSLVYSTTGMISRELFATADRAEHFYMQGSMGHAIGLGLGTALTRPSVPVAVIDGDGAALMHLGGMALVGQQRPANLTHVVLDNRVYESTGGQSTRRGPVRWADLAQALGYRTGQSCDTVAAIAAHLDEIAHRPGPHMVAVPIDRGGSPTPPRVTSTHTNSEVRARFQRMASNDGLPVG
jgi:phosphonopyruvate decarboxylase